MSISDGILSPAARPRGGVKAPHHKNTAERPSVRMPVPPLVILPLRQHIGAPLKTLVKPGDTVKVGQIIADSDAFVCAPLHSSASGKVKSIKPLLLPGGDKSDAVYIETDGEQTVDESALPPKINSREDLIKAARDCGLVGLGGAGFPAHVKLTPRDGKKIDTMLINGAECEPYITSDYRECIENADNLMKGVYTVLEYLGIDRVLIAIEDNKPKAIELLRKIANDERDVGDRVQVVRLKSRYPQGAEKTLIQAALNRRVPMGALPSDVGCVVMNVTSLSILNYYMDTGLPLVRKRITVDGGAVTNPQNVFVPIGTPIADLIEFCGGYKERPEKLLMGGPMMGMALYDDSLPILKQNNAVLALTRAETVSPKEDPCIRCGRCAEVCPMSLMPTLIERYARAGDAKTLEKIGVGVCMECGSCAYACPARRPLVQYLRGAKAVQRKAANNK